jgi:hypothetical protein
MITPNPEIASAQSAAISSKANYWREYIITLANELNSTHDFYLLRAASLWATTFAYIEWLTAFEHYKERIYKADVATTLSKTWGWHEDIGKLFWQSGRNPVAHVGQANSFHNYCEFNGLPSNVSLDSSNKWTVAVTGEWDKYHSYKAVAILPPLDTGDGSVQIVTFHHQMLLAELLPILGEYVSDKISKETNTNNLSKIVALNSQIPH